MPSIFNVYFYACSNFNNIKNQDVLDCVGIEGVRACEANVGTKSSDLFRSKCYKESSNNQNTTDYRATMQRPSFIGTHYTFHITNACIN